jgi:hypothetical protein
MNDNHHLCDTCHLPCDCNGEEGLCGFCYACLQDLDITPWKEDWNDDATDDF